MLIRQWSLTTITLQSHLPIPQFFSSSPWGTMPPPSTRLVVAHAKNLPLSNSHISFSNDSCLPEDPCVLSACLHIHYPTLTTGIASKLVSLLLLFLSNLFSRAATVTSKNVDQIMPFVSMRFVSGSYIYT